LVENHVFVTTDQLLGTIKSREAMPSHLAIIMDGNGRWAKQRGQHRVFGHESGAESVKKIVKGCLEVGIPYLTLYTFSTENWNRPQQEVDMLMSLLISSLENELEDLQRNKICIKNIGSSMNLPVDVLAALDNVTNLTQKNQNITVTLALNYGGKEELTQVMREVAVKVKNNIISVEKIDESTINKHLYTQNLPDVDLLIRTGGEKRLSNFLLWQSAYAELYFTDVLWPDFTKKELFKAIIDFQNRERRFGKTSEQIYE
jgi:undecaprenyl diphosphate synthase